MGLSRVYGATSTVFEVIKETVKKSDGRDKIVKAGAAYSQAAKLIAEYSGASVRVQEGFEALARAGEDARIPFSMVNILGGIVPDVKNNFLTCIAILISSCWNVEKKCFVWTDSKESSAAFVQCASRYIPIQIHNETIIVPKARAAKQFGKHALEHGYLTAKERFLGLFLEVSQFFGGLAYIAGFGAFRPTQFVSRHFKATKTQAIAKDGFLYSMAVMHVFAVIGNTLNLVHEVIVFIRYQSKLSPDQLRRLEGNEDAEAKLQKFNINEFRSKFCEVVIEGVLVYGEKGFELAKDVLVIGKIKHKPAGMIFINVGIGTLSLALAFFRSISEVSAKAKEIKAKKDREA